MKCVQGHTFVMETYTCITDLRERQGVEKVTLFRFFFLASRKRSHTDRMSPSMQREQCVVHAQNVIRSSYVRVLLATPTEQ